MSRREALQTRDAQLPTPRPPLGVVDVSPTHSILWHFFARASACCRADQISTTGSACPSEESPQDCTVQHDSLRLPGQKIAQGLYLCETYPLPKKSARQAALARAKSRHIIVRAGNTPTTPTGRRGVSTLSIRHYFINNSLSCEDGSVVPRLCTNILL